MLTGGTIPARRCAIWHRRIARISAWRETTLGTETLALVGRVLSIRRRVVLLLRERLLLLQMARLLVLLWLIDSLSWWTCSLFVDPMLASLQTLP